MLSRNDILNDSQRKMIIDAQVAKIDVLIDVILDDLVKGKKVVLTEDEVIRGVCAFALIYHPEFFKYDTVTNSCYLENQTGE